MWEEAEAEIGKPGMQQTLWDSKKMAVLRGVGQFSLFFLVLPIFFAFLGDDVTQIVGLIIGIKI